MRQKASFSARLKPLDMCSVNCVIAAVERGERRGGGGTIKRSFSLKAGSTEWGWVGDRGGSGMGQAARCILKSGPGRDDPSAALYWLAAERFDIPST